MSSLFGLEKIKISLVLSLFCLILINALIFNKLLKTEDIPTAPFSCDRFNKEILFQKERQNKTWDLLGDVESVTSYCNYFVEDKNKYISISFIEKDNQTYFMNLVTLKSISNELRRLYKQNTNYNIELDNFKSLNTIQKIRILEILKTTQIKQYPIVKPFENLYSKLFDTNGYVLHFIISINILCLIITIYLTHSIISNIFINVDKKLSILIILNIFFLPLNSIYYLSFYKEPFLLLSLLLIFFNFFNLLDKNKNFKNICFSTIVLLLALQLIKFIKYPYYLIYMLIFTLSYLIFLTKYKNFKDKLIVIFQLILILSFVISPKIQINNFFNEKIKKSFDEKVQSDKLYFDVKDNTVTKNPSNQNKSKKPKEILANNHKLEKIEGYKHLTCDEPFLNFCKKINTFAFTLHYIKDATINENVNNQNIVNVNVLSGTKEIILNIPISTIKGFIMPLKFSKNKMIIFLSIFKISVILILIYFSILFFKAKKLDILEKFFYIILLLMPLSLAIDMVTSNYFTYFRYVMPINIFLLLFVFFFPAEILINKNVKYNS
tara:strand:+ start:226 stop:1875 length:1650 start_codon:yes stop_codon:yes gene_type:complete